MSPLSSQRIIPRRFVRLSVPERLYKSFGARESFLVINNFFLQRDKARIFSRHSVGDRQSRHRLLGIIPDDETIQRYQEDGILVAQTGLVECKAAFTNIAARICGEDVPLLRAFRKKAARKYLAALLILCGSDSADFLLPSLLF